MKCLLNARTFGCYNGKYYFYRQNVEGSNSVSFSKKVYIDVKETLNEWKRLAYEESSDLVRNSIIKFICYEYMVFLHECTEYISGDIEWHKNMCILLKCQKDKRFRFVYFMTKLLGVKNTSYLLNTYVNHRAS